MFFRAVYDGSVRLGDELIDQWRRHFSGSHIAADCRKRHIENSEARRLASGDSIPTEQTTRDARKHRLGLFAESLRFLLHFDRPAFRQKVLPSMQQHDPSALQVVANSAG
jgi:hypothetical protein